MQNEHPDVVKRFYTVKEISTILNISPQTIYNAMSKKTFPIKPKRMGKAVRFDIKDIEAFIQKI